MDIEVENEAVYEVNSTHSSPMTSRVFVAADLRSVKNTRGQRSELTECLQEDPVTLNPDDPQKHRRQ